MRIGIDLGGTKIEGIVVSFNGEIRARKRKTTPSGDYLAIVNAVVELVSSLAQETGISDNTPLGIGIPGTLSAVTGLVKNANSTCLIGKPIDIDLAQATGRKIRVANDANCFTISESTDGAAANYELVLGVILGTGVGSGISFRKTIWQGRNSIAGEWGHNPLPWPQELDGWDERPGETCYCGQTGCIETFLSGSGLTRDHERHTGKLENPKSIIDDRTLKRYEHRLARALASAINILDPDAVVLGGGISNLQRLYENVPVLWQNWIFNDEVKTSLLKNFHGDSSGVRGAAWLWPADQKPDP